MKTSLKFLSDPKNRGKHVIVVAGRVFTAKDAKRARQILNQVRNKFPHQKITLTYVPKADTLILFV